jgi:hypothetical protein
MDDGARSSVESPKAAAAHLVRCQYHPSGSSHLRKPKREGNAFNVGETALCEARQGYR